MPFTNVKLQNGIIKVEHEVDATEEEIIQLAREKFAAEQGGSLTRTAMGLGTEIAVAGGGKLAGTRAGALLGARLGSPGGLPGVVAGTTIGGAVGYLVSAIGMGAAGSYLRQKISRPGGKISEGQMVADVFINLLPYAQIGKGADLLTRSTRQFAAGGAVAAGATVIESQIDHGNLPTLEELTKIGLTGGVLSVGLHMTGDALIKSYKKYGGRPEEDLLDGLRKRDPDAQALFDGVMMAAVKNSQETNRKISNLWATGRENFDDDLYRLGRLQDQVAGGFSFGGELPKEYKGVPHLKVFPDMFDPKTDEILGKEGIRKFPEKRKVVRGNDAYMYMTLAQGIIQKRIEKLSYDFGAYNDSLKLKSKLYKQDMGLMSQKIEEYLHAKRAIGQNKPPGELSFNEMHGDGAAGRTMAGEKMTTAYAEKIIQEFEFEGFPRHKAGTVDLTADSSLLDFLRPEVKMLETIASDIRQTLYDGGVITKQTFDDWSKREPDWVSFKRVPPEGVEEGDVGGWFFSGRGVADPTMGKRAKGDPELKVNILENLVSTSMEAIRLAENNKAMLVFKRLLEEPINKKTTDSLVRITRAAGRPPPGPKDPVLTVFDPLNPYVVHGQQTVDPTEPAHIRRKREEIEDLPEIKESDEDFYMRREREWQALVEKEQEITNRTKRSPSSGRKVKGWTEASSKLYKDEADPNSEYSRRLDKELREHTELSDKYRRLNQELQDLNEKEYGLFDPQTGDPIQFGPDVLRRDPPKKYQTAREFKVEWEANIKKQNAEMDALEQLLIREFGEKEANRMTNEHRWWDKYEGEFGESIKFYIDFGKDFKGVDPGIAYAIRGVNRSQLGTILKGFYLTNKWLGAVYTGGSPLSFTPANFVRDRMVSAMSVYRYLDGASFKRIIDPRVAATEMNSIRRGLFGKRPGEPGYEKEQALLTPEQKILDAHRERWEAEGGPTGGLVSNLFGEIEADMQDFSINNNDFSRKGLMRRARALISFIKKGNQVIEDGTRFSVYLQHIKKGTPPAEAAFYAKNSTFNPQQQGVKGDHLKSLYLFSNPTIQSTKNFWRNMKDPKLWQPVLGFTFGAALVIETYNSLIDPDWRDKVKGGPDKSSWRLNKNLVVVSPLPNEDGSLSYTQVPLAHEVSPIWTSLNGMARLITGTPDSANDVIKETSSAILDGYNPTGGSIIPTVPLRIAELTMLNKDGLGREIVPQRLLEENMAAYGKVHPWTAQTVGGEIAIELSKEIENLGAQVSPEKLKYLFEMSFGGAGQDIMRVFDLTSKIFNGEEISVRDVPLFRRFFGATYADAFEKRTGMEPDLKLFEYEQNTLSSQNYQDAFFILDKIKNIEDPAERNMILQAELAVANKSVSRRVRKMLADEAKGITRTDRQIRKLGVENGLRSEFYQEQIERMAPEAVGQFLIDQKRKNILTDNVEKQLRIANALRTINADESEGRGLPLISIGDPNFPKTKEELRRRRGPDQLRPNWQPY